MNDSAIASAPPSRLRKVNDIIAAADLPPALADLVREVVRRTRLWRSEKRDVALELCGHLRDGLDAGASAEQLRGSFGEPRDVAKLIRRAKKRNRPLMWRAARRMVQVVGACLAIVIGIVGFFVVRLVMGQPTISVDYLAQLNAPAMGHPADQIAWPRYRAALLKLKPEYETSSLFPSDRELEVTSPEWPGAAAWLNAHRPLLDEIHEASQMPHMGFVPGYGVPAEDRNLWPEMATPNYSGFNSPLWDTSMMAVLLPYMGEMRRLARTLGADVWRAGKERDGADIVADIEAILGIARHCREIDLLINDLVAMAILNLAKDRTLWVLAHHPESLSDDQVRHLAHRFAALTDEDMVPRFFGERLGFYDTVQRAYTDDGDGDGYLTLDGLAGMQSMVSVVGNKPARNASEILFVPLVTLGRRELLEEYDRYMDHLQATARVPLWARTGQNEPNLLDRTMNESSFSRARLLPLVLLLPAVERVTVEGQMTVFGRDIVLTALAIEAYRRDQGKPPASLSELVPSYLPEIPRDVFDGQPIRYVLRDGKPLLYSLGVDRDDDGAKARVAANGKVDQSAAMRWRPAPPPNVRIISNIDDDGDWILWPNPNDP